MTFTAAPIYTRAIYGDSESTDINQASSGRSPRNDRASATGTIMLLKYLRSFMHMVYSVEWDRPAHEPVQARRETPQQAFKEIVNEQETG
jgi:hypothetical protein